MYEHIFIFIQANIALIIEIFDNTEISNCNILIAITISFVENLLWGAANKGHQHDRHFCHPGVLSTNSAANGRCRCPKYGFTNFQSVL